MDRLGSGRGSGREMRQDQTVRRSRVRPSSLLQRPRSSQVGVRRRIFQLQLVVGPSLVVKFKILNMSHRTKIL